MTEITDEPPPEIQEELAQLRSSLDEIPSKAIDNNLLIATWNICHFGDLTKKWKSSLDDSPKRDFHSILCIGEMISRFDVIAIQEIKSNLRALRYLMKWLGPDWQFLITDETKGKLVYADAVRWVKK